MSAPISIIIPCYNEASTMPSKLEGLIKNPAAHLFEIIVVDCSKSTDNLEEICKNYKEISYIKSEISGRAIQMNLGASKAKHDILLFLHADVTLPPDFVELINIHLQHNEAGFFNYEFDKQGFWMRFNASFVKEKGTFTGGGDQCHFFKKETFQKLKGYNPEYLIMEDFELIDRVKKAKISYSIIETPVTVSARKYEKNSWLKVSLINGYVFLLYKLGASPQRLKKGYSQLLRK